MLSKIAIAAAATVLIGAGALWLAIDGDDEPPIEIGLEDTNVLLHERYYDRERALDQARDLGVTRIRVTLFWSSVPGSEPDSANPPARPRYEFSELHELIDAAERRGMSVQVGLAGPAPAWASGDGKVGPVRPDPKAFAGFAGAAAAALKGRVARFSIWNEPNHAGWIEPLDEAAEIYRQLYLAGYAAIKEADPEAKVLIGETSPYEDRSRARAPLEFLRDLACVDDAYEQIQPCEKLEADGFAHHPYEFEDPPESVYPGEDNVTIGSLSRLVNALDRLHEADVLSTPGGQPLDIYLTEFGYFATGTRALPPKTRARYLRRAFELASREPRVRQMTQYLLVEPPEDAPGAFFNTAIVSLDGDPHPAYRALARWVDEATGD